MGGRSVPAWTLSMVCMSEPSFEHQLSAEYDFASGAMVPHGVHDTQDGVLVSRPRARSRHRKSESRSRRTQRTRQIEVGHLGSTWFATRADLPWLADPDTDGGDRRHADRSTLRWGAIAAAADLISGVVIQTVGRFRRPLLDPFPIELDGRRLGLTGTELDILTSLFAGDEVARCDPWDAGLDDGHHRLWCAWEENPDAVLPIRSKLLEGLRRLPANAALAPVFRDVAGRGLSHLSPGVASRSALYVDELHRVVRGESAAPTVVRDRWPFPAAR